jgi:uncharacterized protein YdcH (DUF465 family)
MFEHRQEQMEQMLKSNDEFRAIYNRHQQLDKQVTAAEEGEEPMDDLTLSQLKKKKLQAKDQLARLMAHGNA